MGPLPGGPRPGRPIRPGDRGPALGRRRDAGVHRVPGAPGPRLAHVHPVRDAARAARSTSRLGSIGARLHHDPAAPAVGGRDRQLDRGAARTRRAARRDPGQPDRTERWQPPVRRGIRADADRPRPARRGRHAGRDRAGRDPGSRVAAGGDRRAPRRPAARPPIVDARCRRGGQGVLVGRRRADQRTRGGRGPSAARARRAAAVDPTRANVEPPGPGRVRVLAPVGARRRLRTDPASVACHEAPGVRTLAHRGGG